MGNQYTASKQNVGGALLHLRQLKIFITGGTMAILHKLQNIDKFYEYCTDKGPTRILNDSSIYLAKDVESITEEIKTIHDSEMLSNIASCLCTDETTRLEGNFRVGEICTNCGTEVKLGKSNYDPTLWCKAFGDTKFINPKIWMLINHNLSTRYDSLLYLCDPSYKPKSKPNPYLDKIKNAEGYQVSYRYLYENLEDILDMLIKVVTKPKREILSHLLDTITSSKADMYSNYLPILGKKIFVTEQTSVGRYSDMGLASSIDITMNYLKASQADIDEYSKEQVMANAVASTAAMVKEYYGNALAHKNGGSRDKIHLTEIGFSGRAVGTSITRSHHMERFQLPWKVGIVLFKGHLINKLVRKHKHSLKEAHRRLIKYHHVHDTLIASLFKEIIAESKFEDGVPMLVQRNPTLKQSSLLFLPCDGIKDNPHDATISLSVLLMTFLAGDFDGDNYNFALLYDNFLADGLRVLRPATSVMSTQSPGELGGEITVTKATATTFAKMINCGTEEDIVELNDIFTLE